MALPMVAIRQPNTSTDSTDRSPIVFHDDIAHMDENDYLFDGSRRSRRSKLQQLYRCCNDGLASCGSRCWRCFCCCCKEKELHARQFWLGRPTEVTYPANIIRNQKYSIITFIPLVLFEQFRYFLNFFFLVMASSQFIAAIRVGYLYTYWGPLIFVILVTMLREAVDDIRRWRRDREVNSQKYTKLTPTGPVVIPSSKIKVGDIIQIDKNQRVPADVVLLRTTEKSGACFIRTDQLDGETDWKLRLAVNATQRLTADTELFNINGEVYAEKPQKHIHSFIGTFKRCDEMASEESLAIENALWTNTVVASGNALGVVVYTGRETRSAMNTSTARMKFGRLDAEVNNLTKLLFLMVMVLSLIMIILKGFNGPWYSYFIRFVILFSYIIPISLRVNLDMGKIVYTWFIQRDKNIPDTVVRNTTIPEELGRIQYLMSDKTGTLTQNEMIFKKLHLGTGSFSQEALDEIQAHLKTAYSQGQSKEGVPGARPQQKVRRTITTKVLEAVKALALCHNVTPVYDVVDDSSSEVEADQQSQQTVSYQASSPDEVALVSWTEQAGLTLVKRDLNTMTLRTPKGDYVNYTILQIFPFTSETKRMGIILKEEGTDDITFYMKGADVVMQTIVQYNDWLDEECGNMAREGLRTLVVAKKSLTAEQYLDFEARYHQAKMAVQDRSMKVSAVVESLERDLELLCLTGVEDKLQEGVRNSLELLRNAGIKVWMLTGDKLETAENIAKSAKLVPRAQELHIFKPVTGRQEAHQELNALRRKTDTALIIQGDSLQVVLQFYEHEFIDLACQAPAVVVCRCSPTQKADIVRLIKEHTGKITSAIGDGGNDVSMIQEANVGIGIVGREGRQASLAADFSITQFSHIGRLVLVHGRNSYKRSCSLSQFVIHRGLIISTMQAVFCSVFYFSSIALFPGFLMVGYATVFTNWPVFSLVLDKDVSSKIAMTYPELYKELAKGRSLNYKTFFMWVLISIYQGGIIMYGSFLLFDQDFVHVVSITFTSLILTELLMVAATVHTFHWIMVFMEFFSLGWYILALFIFKDYFDSEFLLSLSFMWKVLAVTAVSCIPLFLLKYLRKKIAPPSYTKLT